MGVIKLIFFQERKIYPYPHIFWWWLNIKRYGVYFLSVISIQITWRKKFIIIKMKKEEEK